MFISTSTWDIRQFLDDFEFTGINLQTSDTRIKGSNKCGDSALAKEVGSKSIDLISISMVNINAIAALKLSNYLCMVPVQSQQGQLQFGQLGLRLDKFPLSL